MMRPALPVLAVLLFSLAAAAAPGFRWRDGERVLLLGDSITAAGGYPQFVEAYVRTRFPERRIEIVNLGLPSETVTGLSEPDHPFPRPNVHERLDRALARVKPTFVVACYGMNDGIYHPFAEERFRAFQAGIRSLVAQCRAAGARVALLTPSAFDPLPVARAVRGPGEAKYSWLAPFRDYDQVLERYSRWLLAQRAGDLPVGDAHGAVTRHLQAMRRTDAAYHTAGDGVHPNTAGQWLLAGVLLDLLGAPAEVASAEVDAPRLRARAGEVDAIRRDGEGVRFTWTTPVPLAYDPAWPAGFVAAERLTERFNRQRLTVRGLPPGRYRLFDDGREVGSADAAAFAAGVDLLQYPALTTNRRAAEVLRLVRQRERLLSAAWVSEVGHQRPNTPAGLPLAEAREKAGVLEEQLRRAASPVALELAVRR